MRTNIKLRLFRLVPIALLALLNNVISKLTGNALFPLPPISLAALIKLRDQFRAIIESATNGSLEARRQRDAMVLEVRDALRVTADYVRAQCDGDAAKLASSGFELYKERERVHGVGVPSKLTASATSVKGQVLLRWPRTVGARMFRVEKALADPAAGNVQWVTVAQISRQRVVVNNLEPYAPNWFRVVAIGVDSEGLPSAIVVGRAA